MNGRVSTADALAPVNAINNGQAAQCANLPRYDLNRSSAVSAADLLRLVQLLNGTNTTQAFNGQTLATARPPVAELEIRLDMPRAAFSCICRPI